MFYYRNAHTQKHQQSIITVQIHCTLFNENVLSAGIWIMAMIKSHCVHVEMYLFVYLCIYVLFRKCRFSYSSLPPLVPWSCKCTNHDTDINLRAYFGAWFDNNIYDFNSHWLSAAPHHKWWLIFIGWNIYWFADLLKYL